MSEKILTISLLCCGREKETIRCLDSLKPVLESIPSELIIVDTGCSDKFIEVLKTYTDRIYQYTWNRDFAAARNVGVDNASGEWFMYIDDDEWISDCTPLIRFFDSGEYKNYAGANYKVRNYVSADMNKYSDGWTARLFAMGKSKRFTGKIHEHVERDGDIYYMDMIAEHTGYIYQTEAERIEHSRRNIVPLKEMIDEDPTDIRSCLHLVNEYYAVEEYDAMLDIAEQILGSIQGDDKLVPVYLGAFYSGAALAAIGMHDYYHASEIVENASKDDRMTDYGLCRIFNLATKTYVGLGKFDKAIDAVSNYISIFVRLSDNETEIGKNTIFFSAEGFLPNIYNETLEAGIIAAIKTGLYDEVEKYVSILDPAVTVSAYKGEIITACLDAISEGKDSGSAKDILTNLVQHRELYDAFYLGIIRIYYADREKYNVLAQKLSDVYNDCFIFDYLRISAAEATGDDAACQEAIHQISAKHLFAGIEDFCTGNYNEVVSALDSALVKYEMSENKRRFFEMKLAEVQVFHKQPSEYHTFEEILIELGEYASKVVDFYSLYFTDYAFDGDLEMVPDRARYAGFMSGFLTEATNGNYVDAFGLLKEMVKAYKPAELHTLRLTELYGQFVTNNK